MFSANSLSWRLWACYAWWRWWSDHGAALISQSGFNYTFDSWTLCLHPHVYCSFCPRVLWVVNLVIKTSKHVELVCRTVLAVWLQNALLYYIHLLSYHTTVKRCDGRLPQVDAEVGCVVLAWRAGPSNKQPYASWYATWWKQCAMKAWYQKPGLQYYGIHVRSRLSDEEGPRYQSIMVHHVLSHSQALPLHGPTILGWWNSAATRCLRVIGSVSNNNWAMRPSDWQCQMCRRWRRESKSWISWEMCQ